MEVVNMLNCKLKLYLKKDMVLPSIGQVDLSEKDYNYLKAFQGDSYELYLKDDEKGFEYLCQLSSKAIDNKDEYKLYILIDKASDVSNLLLSFLKKEKELYPVTKSHSSNPWHKTKGVYLENQENNSRIMVSIGGALFTRYFYSNDLPKPYFHPLIGPAGKSLLQDAPDDHLHHHSLWWGHDGVNGHQFYHEFKGEGKQVHKHFISIISGPVFGLIRASIDWVSPQGEKILEEVRAMRIFNLPEDMRYIDISSTLHARETDLTFSDTKEGGFPFLRVNEQINAYITGTISSSNNEIGEKEIFAKNADWVDYSGTIVLSADIKDGIRQQNTLELGIALFEDPSSDDYPSKWFIRDYGPFTPANFHFQGGHVIKKHDSFTFKQRIYLHKYDAIKGKVKEAYDDFINPIKGFIHLE